MPMMIGPSDPRKAWWAKFVRGGAAIPQPGAAHGPACLPQEFLPRGKVLLCPGDFVIMAEDKDPHRSYGWTYTLRGLDKNGRRIELRTGQFGRLKLRLKEAGLTPDLLQGRGDLAAAVRVILAIRNGIDVHSLLAN